MIQSERNDGEDSVQADASTTEAPEKVTRPPDVVSIRSADLEKTLCKIEMLEDALRFYMSAFIWCPFDQKVRPSGDMFLDAGNVARQALGVPLLRDYYLRGKKLSLAPGAEVNFSNESVSDAVQLNQPSLLSSSDTEVE